MTYSTSDSRGALLSRQAVNEVDIRKACGDEIPALVEKWRKLPPEEQTRTTLFHRDGLACFVIDRDGASTGEWPDAAANDLSESFFREFSETDGIWETTQREPRCFELSYKVMLETVKIYQVLCPVFDGDKPSAFVVVAQTRDHP